MFPKVRIFTNRAGRPSGVEVDGVRVDFLNSISFDASAEGAGIWRVKLGAEIFTDKIEIVET